MSRTDAMMLDQGFTLQQLISKTIYEAIEKQEYTTLIEMFIAIVNDYTEKYMKKIRF
jgi:hypothetical protein